MSQKTMISNSIYLQFEIIKLVFLDLTGSL